MKKIPKYLNDLLNPKWVFSQQASCGKEKEALIGGETWSECQEEEYKTLSKNIDLTCSIDKDSFHYYESVLIHCNVKNIGNIFLENLSICLKDCKDMDLGITQSKQVEFNFSAEETGKKEIKQRTQRRLEKIWQRSQKPKV